MPPPSKRVLNRPTRDWQWQAWRFYGLPYDSSAGRRTAKGHTAEVETGAIGEIRYLVAWMAEQIGRINWRVLVDGEPLTVTVEGPKGPIEKDRSPEFIDLVTNAAVHEATVQIAINKLVAGELDYVLDPEGAGATPGSQGEWKVVSIIDPDRNQVMDRSALKVEGVGRLWPHPADPEEPDSPMRGVLDILREMEALQAVSRAQNRSRAGMAGIAFISDAVEFAGGESGPAGMQEAFRHAVETPIADLADSASPIVGGVPHSALQDELLKWTVPERPYDERIDMRLDFALRRLAMSFITPPEVLLGLGASSTRAVAFQVEESSYRAHVEPAARHVAETLQAALRLVMDAPGLITVEPDPTDLLARKHSVADTLNAWDRGLVKAEWVLHTLGIPVEMMADEDDLERIERVARRGRDRPIRDPAQQVDEEPVSGSASMSLEERAAEMFTEGLSVLRDAR
jgi:hypothetical protein